MGREDIKIPLRKRSADKITISVIICYKKLKKFLASTKKDVSIFMMPLAFIVRLE